MSLYDRLSPGAKELYNKVANIFGNDNIVLTSTRRDPLFGNNKSQHNVGDAFDFKVKGYTNEQVVAILHNSNLDYRQLINEVSGPNMTGPHVHIGAGRGNETAQIVGGKYSIIDPESPYRDSITGAINGAYEWVKKEIEEITKPATNAINDPVGAAFGLIPTELASRIVAVVLGIILVGLAIAAFNFSGRVAAATQTLVKG